MGWLMGIALSRHGIGRAALGMAALTLALAAAPLAMADYEAGQRAWEAGRVDEALPQWRAAADAGDGRAMLALGRLYVQGLGVLQDYVEAHKWLNLAASRGEAAALGERDAVTAKMTPAQIAEAQEQAGAWRPGRGRVNEAAARSGGSPTASTTSTPTANQESPPPPPRAIREAQTLLRALGYQPGPADGKWGQRAGEAQTARTCIYGHLEECNAQRLSTSSLRRRLRLTLDDPVRPPHHPTDNPVVSVQRA